MGERGESGRTRNAAKEQMLTNKVQGTSDKTVACVYNVHRGSNKTMKTKDTGVQGIGVIINKACNQPQEWLVCSPIITIEHWVSHG